MSLIKKHITNIIFGFFYPKPIRMNYSQISTFNFQFLIAYLLLPIACYLTSTTSTAQQEKKFIREGNKQYENKNYTEAEKSYSKGLNKNKNSYKGSFNLGDAYYQQGKYEEAATQFQSLTHVASSKDTLSKAYHNLGNALLKLKKYQEGADAYKNALKNNPNDEDTRYNLAYAQQMLKQQENKNKDKKDNQDKNQKDKDKKNQEKKEEKKKEKEKPEKNEISKEDAKRLLDALQNDEKNIQEKMKKGKIQGMKGKIEKDW